MIQTTAIANTEAAAQVKTVWTEERIVREAFNYYEGRDRVGLERLIRKVARGEIKIDS